MKHHRAWTRLFLGIFLLFCSAQAFPQHSISLESSAKTVFAGTQTSIQNMSQQKLTGETSFPKHLVNAKTSPGRLSFLGIVILILAGLFAGFINTLAGGGSAITLSALLFLGLPASVANGTNRIALLMQNIVAVGSFQQQKQLESRKALLLALPALVGAVIGSLFAVDVDENIIRKAIAVVLLLMLIMLFYKPQQWLSGNAELRSGRLRWWLFPLFFIMGIYAGFLHLGIGYGVLASVVLGAGYDLVKANAIKLLIILIWTPVTIYVFYVHGQLAIWYGITLGIGNFTGAFIATRMAVKKGSGFVRWVIVVVIIGTSLHLLGVL